MGHKVQMILSDQDKKNAQFIEANLNLNNKAESISYALEIVADLMKFVHEGKQIIVKDKNGTYEIKFKPC